MTAVFQNEDIRTVIDQIRPDNQMVVLDLKRAFYHVREKDLDYIGFQFKGRVYSWHTLPFGWGCSPYYHTKVLRPGSYYILKVPGNSDCVLQ